MPEFFGHVSNAMREITISPCGRKFKIDPYFFCERNAIHF